MKMQDSTMSKCFFMMKLTEPDTVNMECSCSVPGKRKPVSDYGTEYKIERNNSRRYSQQKSEIVGKGDD